MYCLGRVATDCIVVIVADGDRLQVELRRAACGCNWGFGRRGERRILYLLLAQQFGACPSSSGRRLVPRRHLLRPGASQPSPPPERRILYFSIVSPAPSPTSPSPPHLSSAPTPPAADPLPTALKRRRTGSCHRAHTARLQPSNPRTPPRSSTHPRPGHVAAVLALCPYHTMGPVGDVPGHERALHLSGSSFQ